MPAMHPKSGQKRVCGERASADKEMSGHLKNSLYHSANCFVTLKSH